MTVPTSYGGGGRTSLERYVVIEELLAAGAPIAAHWIADRQIAPAILAHGTETQRRRYLPEICSARSFFALGMSESEAGSDLAAVRTRASVADGGWRLNGTKLWTSGAHAADTIIVLARTSDLDEHDRHAGLSQFLCDLPTPGVSVNPIRSMTGEHHFNEVVFDDVFLPNEAVLGAVGEGWTQVTAELAHERSGPERFLSTFPLLSAMCSQIAGDSGDGPFDHSVVGSLVARAWSLRRMSVAVAAALGRGEKAAVPAAIVKDLGTCFEQDVVDAALTGLDGADADLASALALPRLLARAVMHSPGFTLRGGTNEILRGVVAREMGLR
jgi:hypothetical protein